MLLHKGDVYPSIPLAHSVELNEYSSDNILLDTLKYEMYVWEVIVASFSDG